MNNVNKQNILPRKVKISETLEFLGKAGAGLTYLRGRRRTGKSFILKQCLTKKKVYNFAK